MQTISIKRKTAFCFLLLSALIHNAYANVEIQSAPASGSKDLKDGFSSLSEDDLVFIIDGKKLSAKKDKEKIDASLAKAAETFLKNKENDPAIKDMIQKKKEKMKDGLLFASVMDQEAVNYEVSEEGKKEITKAKEELDKIKVTHYQILETKSTVISNDQEADRLKKALTSENNNEKFQSKFSELIKNKEKVNFYQQAISEEELKNTFVNFGKTEKDADLLANSFNGIEILYKKNAPVIIVLKNIGKKSLDKKEIESKIHKFIKTKAMQIFMKKLVENSKIQLEIKGKSSKESSDLLEMAMLASMMKNKS